MNCKELRTELQKNANVVQPPQQATCRTTIKEKQSKHEFHPWHGKNLIAYDHYNNKPQPGWDVNQVEEPANIGQITGSQLLGAFVVC